MGALLIYDFHLAAAFLLLFAVALVVLRKWVLPGLVAFAALPPTGTVVPDDFATANAFLQDRFGIDVLNDGVALDPAGGGLAIQGLGGDPIGSGVAGTLGPSFFGGRDTLALVGTGKPTFLAALRALER